MELLFIIENLHCIFVVILSQGMVYFQGIYLILHHILFVYLFLQIFLNIFFFFMSLDGRILYLTSTPSNFTAVEGSRLLFETDSVIRKCFLPNNLFNSHYFQSSLLNQIKPVNRISLLNNNIIYAIFFGFEQICYWNECERLKVIKNIKRR